MSAAPHTPWRLQRLALILAESKPSASASARDTDPADVHLDSVPLERIHRLTLELTQRASSDSDDVDGLAMRLLLNDYSSAVAHLRAVTRLTERRIADATAPIEDAKLQVRHREKRAKGSRPVTT
jgi:hypothetical protein